MSPRRAVPDKKNKRGLPLWIRLGAIVIIVVAAIIIGMDFTSKAEAPAAAPTVSGVTGTGRTLGNPHAPIAFVVFADFQCPYCREFALTAESQIVANYVKTGKIGFTYKYFPIIDGGNIGESHWAAEAAECANEQGKFWEYHDKLIQVWTGENVCTFTKPKLEQYAAELGLNTASFSQCLESDQTASVVASDVAEGTQLGVQATPSFFVNNQPLVVQSFDYSQFAQAFDSLLK